VSIPLAGHGYGHHAVHAPWRADWHESARPPLAVGGAKCPDPLSQFGLLLIVNHHPEKAGVVGWIQCNGQIFIFEILISFIHLNIPGICSNFQKCVEILEKCKINFVEILVNRSIQ
jgi:hypothetical protein